LITLEQVRETHNTALHTIQNFDSRIEREMRERCAGEMFKFAQYDHTELTPLVLAGIQSLYKEAWKVRQKFDNQFGYYLEFTTKTEEENNKNDESK
jgi:hypothetical protein